jgi:hypothetical protein
LAALEEESRQREVVVGVGCPHTRSGRARR